MYNNLLANFESCKVDIVYPDIQNIIILLIFTFIAVVSSRKQDTILLDKTQTDQLKGIAIFFVVIGHLWYHVSSNKVIPTFGGQSVTLFLILSGFGLSLSYKGKHFLTGEFIKKRIVRVLIPYWITTMVILLLDAVILNRIYAPRQIFYTFMGINIDMQLRYLDYTRWFITLLLVYYAGFALAKRFFSTESGSVFFLFFFGCLIVILRLVRLFPFGTPDQILAFPLGCWIACRLGPLRAFLSLRSRNKLFFTLLIASLSLVIFIYSYVSDQTMYNQTFSKLVSYAVFGLSSIIFCTLLVFASAILSQARRVSAFLSFCGLISFEIYLVHGPLLIKYNPVMGHIPVNYTWVGFTLLFGIILTLAFILHRISRGIHDCAIAVR